MKVQLLVQVSSGSTAAYYLSKKKTLEVTVFDHGLGQTTRRQLGLSTPGFPSVVIKPGIKINGPFGSRFLPI